MPTNNKGLKELWGYPLIDEKARNAISDTRSSLENDFQKKTDDTLGTTDKTVPGAINEIKNNIDTIGDNFTSEQSDTKYDMKYKGKSIGSIGMELAEDKIIGEGGSFNIDLTPYQTKTDTSLTTTDKTISGAIKELNTQYKDIKNEKVNISSLSYINAKDNGAKGDGITDDSDIINLLLKTNKNIILNNGKYYIGKTIEIPENGNVLMENAEILLKDDIDLFIFNNNSRMENIIINTDNCASYTKSLIKNNNSGIKNNVFIDVKVKRTIDEADGKVFDINCTETQDIVMFSTFKFYIEKFKNPIYVSSKLTDTNFANGNIFTGFIFDCEKAVINDNADGNNYIIYGQSKSNIQDENLPLIKIKGNYNKIDGFVFDIGNDGHSKVYLEIDGRNNINNCPVNSNYIKNTDLSQNIDIVNYYYRNLPSRSDVDIYGNEGLLLGDQSNFLVSADKRFSVQENKTGCQNYSNLSNAFIVQNNDTTGLTYHFDNLQNDNDYGEIIINFDKRIPIRLFGLTFRMNEVANKTILGVYLNNSWKYCSFSNQIVCCWNLIKDFSYDDILKIEKLSVKVYSPEHDRNNNLTTITSIFATSHLGGNAFIPTHGGDVYGNLTFNNSSPILISPNNTKYKIAVDDTGSITSQKI